MNFKNVVRWLVAFVIVNVVAVGTLIVFSYARVTVQEPATSETVDKTDQFNFWVGDWKVENKHLQPSGEWRPGGIAKAEIRTCLDGGAIIEQWNGQGNLALRGFSLRTYDAEQDRWEIVLNWHGGAPSGFSMMVGNFADGRGEFFPPGGPKRNRFTFSKAKAESCQWDQANSKDGKDWTTDWVMSFSRTGPAASLDASTLPIIKPHPSVEGKFPETRQLDHLIGVWQGTAKRIKPDGTEENGTAIRRVTSMIDGYALLQLTDYSWGEKSVAAISYNLRQKRWFEVGTSSAEPDCHWLSGEIESDRLRLDEIKTSNNGVNHVWESMTDDSFKWIGETRKPGETDSPTIAIEVEFKRVESDAEIEKAPLSD